MKRLLGQSLFSCSSLTNRYFIVIFTCASECVSEDEMDLDQPNRPKQGNKLSPVKEPNDDDSMGDDNSTTSSNLSKKLEETIKEAPDDVKEGKKIVGEAGKNKRSIADASKPSTIEGWLNYAPEDDPIHILPFFPVLTRDSISRRPVEGRRADLAAYLNCQIGLLPTLHQQIVFSQPTNMKKFEKLMALFKTHKLELQELVAPDDEEC